MPRKTAPQPQKLLGRLVKQWKLLIPIATWIMATIGSFWVPPPPDLSSQNEPLVSFGKFIVTVLLGLMILPMIKWGGRKKYAWLWGKITVVALISGIIAFFTFQQLLSNWTVKHGDKVLYIGTVVKQDVVPFMEAHPSMTKEELLQSAGWAPKNIWTEKSLRRCRLILSALYVLFTPLFAITIMSVAQVIYCAGSTQ
jgi:hypothetical protein